MRENTYFYEVWGFLGFCLGAPFFNLAIGATYPRYTTGLQRTFASNPTTKLHPQTKTKNFEEEWNTAKPFDEIPGPSRLALLRGFMKGGEFANLSFSDMLIRCRQRYGDILKMPGTFGKKTLVMAFNVKDFQKIFRADGVWPNRPDVEALQHYRRKYHGEFFKDCEGLLGSQGQNWSRFRSAVNPVLMKTQNARLYLTPMLKVNNQFIQRIRDIRDPRTLEVPDDFMQYISRLALESVCVVAVDKELGLLRRNQSAPDAQKLFASLNIFFESLYDLDFKPSLYKYFPTPKFLRFKEANDIIFHTTRQYIDESIERLAKEPKTDGELSVLGKLLKIDQKIAVVMALDMMLAGVDTTTSSLVGILLMIAKNQDKQAKLREEINKITPTKDSPLTVEQMKHLPYLRACIKEGIRLYPLSPGFMREVNQDIIMGEYQIPKGTRVILNTNLLVREKRFYPRPNDFIPERWLRDDQVKEQGLIGDESNPFTYLPFGFGPRSCVGKRIVDLEMELTIINLIRNFNIEFNYSIENAFKTYFINSPAIPLKFKFADIN